MTEIVGRANPGSRDHTPIWSELFRKEDWWEIWIGLGLIICAAVAFSNGGSIKWLAVAPQKWSQLTNVAAQLGQHGFRYGALFLLWATLLGLGLAV